MYTLGYSFRPWTNAKAIADGPSILDYVRETARELRHRPQDPLRPPRASRAVVDARTRAGRSRCERSRPARASQHRPAASCSCAAATTTTTTATRRTSRASSASAGASCIRRTGRDDIDYAGKRVVVIGSGATAVTLVPAIAKKAAHVTMLQRSPTYIVSRARRGSRSRTAMRWHLPAKRRLRDRALEERAARHVLLPAVAGAGRPLTSRLVEPACESAARAEATTSRRTSRRATTRGTSACASCPTATCSRRSATAARRSSPIRSTRSPRTGIKLRSGAELEADLSSPRRA